MVLRATRPALLVRYSLSCLSLCLSTYTVAAEPVKGPTATPKLGVAGKQLLDESFTAAELPKNWNRNVGALGVKDGSLEASQRSADNHAAAFRYPVPVQDCIIQVDFQLAAGTKFFHLGFDPAPGELKKKGHLFSVVVTPTSYSILEHGDKNDDKPKNKQHASEKVNLSPGKWYTLTLESKGDQVVAQITGMKPIEATSADFHVKKPGLVFRVSGPDDEAVKIDNVKVWELNPKL